MTHQADLVGDGPSAGGSVGGEMGLVGLDQILGLTSGTVEALVDDARGDLLDVGDDEADVEGEPCRFDAGNGAALARPALGLVTDLGEVAYSVEVFDSACGGDSVGDLAQLGDKRLCSGQAKQIVDARAPRRSPWPRALHSGHRLGW